LLHKKLKKFGEDFKINMTHHINLNIMLYGKMNYCKIDRILRDISAETEKC